MNEDVIHAGLQAGKWKIHYGEQLEQDLQLEADVVIVGTGAGGGISAEILSRAGLRVVMLEEGGLRYARRDFRMKEAEAYPTLYQESAGRQTKDKGITILQGRTVGGSTTVNWTSSFRTPGDTLGFWQREFGLTNLTVDKMAPWFESAERRLHVSDWTVEPNNNNKMLMSGANRLGISWNQIRRNVNGCMNLGYCGMGCPANAKQSMLITTIPTALDQGCILVTNARVQRVLIQGDVAKGIEAQALGVDGIRPNGKTVRVMAKHVVLAGGAINNPALLMRSAAPDPHGTLGKRTFLHPVNISGALFPYPIEPYNGAPQSIYSDHFLHSQPVTGAIGYKLEVPPVHPVLAGITLTGFGAQHRTMMEKFPNLQVVLALLRDGFHDQSAGGKVSLKSDGTPLLDYQITPFVWEGLRRAYLTMAEIQFEAGAERVMPIHEDASRDGYVSWREARQAIMDLPMQTMRARVVSAHVMGGCGMGADPRTSVINEDGYHHQIANLSVIDGSAFPTSIGANPQLSIYGLANRQATLLAEKLNGKRIQLA